MVGAPPRARRHSRGDHQVDLYDGETGRPYEAGIAMLPESADVRRWNLEARALATPVATPTVSRVSTTSRGQQEERPHERVVLRPAREWLGGNHTVGVVGGDHSVPLGLIRATAERHPELGILHIDAHADLRDAYEGFTYSHASIMHNVMRETAVKKLVQVGVRDYCEAEYEAIQASSGRIVTFFDQDLAAVQLAGTSFAETARRIVGELPARRLRVVRHRRSRPDAVPNTGTPVPAACRFIRPFGSSARSLARAGAW